MAETWRQLTAGFLLLLLFGGCGTTQDHRIRVFPRDFQAVDTERQNLIRAGRIDYGFNPRMVYMALGEPQERRQVITADGERTIWTYSGLIRENENVLFRTTSNLIWGSPFRKQAYDYLQVIFEDGEVTRMQTYARRTQPR